MACSSHLIVKTLTKQRFSVYLLIQFRKALFN